MADAAQRLTPRGIEDYLAGASLICRIGRGFEPVLVYLEEMPRVAAELGEETLGLVSQTVWKISRSPNGKAILPFLQSIAEASRRSGQRGAAGALHRDDPGLHGADHRLHPRLPHHHPQPEPPGSAGADPLPAEPAHLPWPGQLDRVRPAPLWRSSGPPARLFQSAIGRQPRRAPARAPRHPVRRQRAPARPLSARPVAWSDRPFVPYSEALRRHCASPCPISTPWGCGSRMSTTTATGWPGSTATAPCWPMWPPICAGAARWWRTT